MGVSLGAIAALFLATAITIVLLLERPRQKGSESLDLVFSRAASKAPFKTTQEFLRTFEICGACEKWERYGEYHDGGYVMCMDAYTGERRGHVTAAYSFGVEVHDKWSEDVASKLDIPVYQFDCTVPEPPEGCSKCHFHSKCIKSSDGHEDNFPGKSWSTQEVLENTGNANAGNGTLLLKMDIEASEWAVYETEGARLLSKFEQILVEFHALGDTSKHAQYLRAMRSILAAGFKVAHIHGNNNEGMYAFRGYQIPNVIEVTFTSGPSRPACEKQQEYFYDLDHGNTFGKGAGPELPMASLP